MLPLHFTPNFILIELQIWLPGGHLGKSPITPELMAGFSTGLFGQAQRPPYGTPAGLKGAARKFLFFSYMTKNNI
jgi:hypothetical protein